MRLLRTELGEEVHLQCGGQLCRRSEGNVDVLVKHLGDVRTRHLHALRKLRLRHPQLLHPEQNAAKERRTNFINRLHSLQPTFTSILFPSPHFSQLAAPTLIQPTSGTGKMSNPVNHLILSKPLTLQLSIRLGRWLGVGVEPDPTTLRFAWLGKLLDQEIHSALDLLDVAFNNVNAVL